MDSPRLPNHDTRRTGLLGLAPHRAILGQGRMHGWENLRDADRDAILKGIADGRAHGGPYHAEIDPIDACNVSCFFCSSENASILEGAALKWERLSEVVDELIAGGLRSFRLAGGGEPLIYPALPALCDRMAQAGVVLDNLTTNGVRLNAMLDHLLKLRMTTVLVSLNYPDAESYGRFMRTAASKFDTVVKNIRELDQRLRDSGRRAETQIMTQFFLHRSMVELIPRMAELAAHLPVDIVTFRVIGLIPEDEVITADQLTRIRELLPRAVETTHRHTWVELDLAIAGLQDYANNLLASLREMPVSHVAPQHRIEYCYIGWYSMTVRGNGNTHPCCFLMPSETIPPFGNLNTQSVQEVWHGELYHRFRQEMRGAMLADGNLPRGYGSFRCTAPGCWKHDDCPLAFMMADPAFYQRAHETLELLRRRPAARMMRMAIAARRMIRRGSAPR
jgi:MoaA/NifB/PqqE/SkfB family radical SAM enzyme